MPLGYSQIKVNVLKLFRKRNDPSINLSLSPEKQKEIKRLAYVPEHIVGLMEAISGGTSHLIKNFLFFVKDNLLIFIGYPLGGFQKEIHCKSLRETIDELIVHFDPSLIFIIAPEIPLELKNCAVEFKKDYYYILNIETFNPERRLLREAEKASKIIRIEKGREFTEKHKELTDKFLKTNALHPTVESLYRSMEGYFKKSDSALMLSAITEKKELTAFYCIDYGADNFLAYILGCHSKANYVPHASDLLFTEMVNIARELKKKEINLGLGVNEGIRRFKEKWGGRPIIPYEFMEWKRAHPVNNFLKEFQSRF